MGKLDAKIKNVATEHRKEQREYHESELLEAQARNDSQNVYFHARQLAGRHVGPKRRDFRKTAAQKHTIVSWMSKLCVPVPKGGCSARPFAIRERRAEASSSWTAIGCFDRFPYAKPDFDF
jgi:hypothetical protein